MISTDAAGALMGAFVRIAVLALELAGTVTIVLGAVIATVILVRRYARGDGGDVLQSYRASLGRSILLGLEFLVAGDILKSLVIDPTLDDLLVLAGLILVRTFLSVSLGVEINGHWPWEETRLKRAQEGTCRE
jgi:uncharacterized membrane protein